MPDRYVVKSESFRSTLKFEVSDSDTPVVRLRTCRLFFVPQPFYLLERLALGLRNKLPYKDRGQDAHDPIYPVRKPIVEFGLQPLIVIHDREGQRDYPVRDSLRSHRDR